MNKKIIKISLIVLMIQNFFSSCDACDGIILERIDKKPSTPKPKQKKAPFSQKDNNPSFIYPRKKLFAPYKKKKISRDPSKPNSPEAPTDDEENEEDGTDFVANKKILNDFLDKFPIMRGKLSKKLLEIIDGAESLKDQFDLFLILDKKGESSWEEIVNENPDHAAKMIKDIFTNDQCKRNVRAILNAPNKPPLFNAIIFGLESGNSVDFLSNVDFDVVQRMLFDLHIQISFALLMKKITNMFNPDIFGFKDKRTNIFINMLDKLGESGKSKVFFDIAHVGDSMAISRSFWSESFAVSPINKAVKFRNAFMGTKEEVQNIVYNIDHVLNYNRKKDSLVYYSNKENVMSILETSRQFILLDKCVDLLKKYNRDQAWLLFTYLQNDKFVEAWEVVEKSGEDVLEKFVEKVDSCVNENFSVSNTLNFIKP